MIKHVVVTQKPLSTRGILVEEESLALICSIHEFAGYQVVYNSEGVADRVTFVEASGRERVVVKFGQVLRRETDSLFRDFSVLDIRRDAEVYDFEVVESDG